MGDEYVRIQKRSTEDQGTAGDQGEENWASLFRDWLPADYQIVTKGRLLSENGIASPQVDVIVLYPFYPKHLLDKKLYLTAGVAAAFECKNTLKAAHIEKSVKNSVEIRNLVNEKQGTYKDEMHSQIIYGLLAHSHSWRKPNSRPLEVIEKRLIESDVTYVKHPRECIDFVCVSDLAVWSSYKQPMTMQLFEHDGNISYGWIPGPQTGFGKSHKGMFKEGSGPYVNFTPIGAFLSKLLKKLALNDSRLSKFSWYFGQAMGGGVELKWRKWSESILSKEAQTDLSFNLKKDKSKWMTEG
jgi:hypothetical protein